MLPCTPAGQGMVGAQGHEKGPEYKPACSRRTCLVGSGILVTRPTRQNTAPGCRMCESTHSMPTQHAQRAPDTDDTLRMQRGRGRPLAAISALAASRMCGAAACRALLVRGFGERKLVALGREAARRPRGRVQRGMAAWRRKLARAPPAAPATDWEQQARRNLLVNHRHCRVLKR